MSEETEATETVEKVSPAENNPPAEKAAPVEKVAAEKAASRQGRQHAGRSAGQADLHVGRWPAQARWRGCGSAGTGKIEINGTR